MATSMPPTSCAMGVRMGRKWGCKTVAEIADLWPESIVAFGIAGPHNPAVLALRRLEKWIYKKADAVVFTMEGAYDYIKEQHWERAVPRSKVHYINNGVDLELFEYNKANFPVEDPDLDDPDTFKVVYTGSIRQVNGLGLLLDAAKEVRDPRVRFLIWGDGDERPALERRVKDENIGNVVFKGRVEKKFVGTEEFSMEQLPAVTAAEELPKESQAGVSTSRVLETKLRLCGLIPIKTVNLQKVETPYVVPCGTPFGLKMLTEGVVVVGLNPVETEAGTICPAKEAGVRKGDVILRAGGKAVSGNRELAEIVRASEGKSVSLLLKRDGVELTLQVVPVKAASDEVYRCGIWVRDSSAGIGTVTFYDPSTGVFGGLGHAVCDVDTGGVMPLAEGQVVPVSIHGVQKGEAGTPGELQGSFLTTLSCGELRKNTETGVYGVLNRNPAAGQEAIPICLRQEVKEGPVQILTTISGTEPALYDAVIEKVSLGVRVSLLQVLSSR